MLEDATNIAYSPRDLIHVGMRPDHVSIVVVEILVPKKSIGYKDDDLPDRHWQGEAYLEQA